MHSESVRVFKALLKVGYFKIKLYLFCRGVVTVYVFNPCVSSGIHRVIEPVCRRVRVSSERNINSRIASFIFAVFIYLRARYIFAVFINRVKLKSRNFTDVVTCGVVAQEMVISAENTEEVNRIGVCIINFNRYNASSVFVDFGIQIACGNIHNLNLSAQIKVVCLTSCLCICILGSFVYHNGIV